MLLCTDKDPSSRASREAWRVFDEQLREGARNREEVPCMRLSKDTRRRRRRRRRGGRGRANDEMGEEEDRAREEEEEAGEIGEGGEQEEEESPRLTSARTGKILSIRYERLPRSAIRIPARTTRTVGRIHARTHVHLSLSHTHVRPRSYCLKLLFPFIVSTISARSHAAGTTGRASASSSSSSFSSFPLLVAKYAFCNSSFSVTPRPPPPPSLPRLRLRSVD